MRKDRVRRSVNPTNRVKARGSSGPVPLLDIWNTSNFINVLIGGRK